MKDPNRFYTYAYLREDGTPYYIGKGCGKRIYSTNRNGLKPPKDKSKIIFLKQNLTEEEAFKHEKYMIAVFGRIDIGTGILRNLTDGGEGASGVIVGKERRKKVSKALQGKIVSKETRRRMSEAQKGKNHPHYGKRGENSHNYGRVASEETKRKMSEANGGENNPAYGKKWWNDGYGNNKLSIECPEEGWVLGRSDEYKKEKSKETKEKMSEANKDKRWWNDGNGNTKFSEKCPGEGWIVGRGKIKRKQVI